MHEYQPKLSVGPSSEQNSLEHHLSASRRGPRLFTAHGKYHELIKSSPLQAFLVAKWSPLCGVRGSIHPQQRLQFQRKHGRSPTLSASMGRSTQALQEPRQGSTNGKPIDNNLTMGRLSPGKQLTTPEKQKQKEIPESYDLNKKLSKPGKAFLELTMTFQNL